MKTFLLSLALAFAALVLCLQAVATDMTKVKHVDGHTCIETRGLVRSITCDWSKP